MGPLSNLHRKARELLGLDPGTDRPGGAVNGVLSGGPPSPISRSTSPPSPLPIGPADAPPARVPIPSDPTVHLRPPRRDEVFGAVRMLLSQPGRSADDGTVAEFLRHAAPPRVDLGLMRLAERRGRILWAVLPVISPGRTALLLAPPAPAAATEAAAAGALVEVACAELAGLGVHLAQALVDPADARGRALFAGRGFAVMADLLYLAGQPGRRRGPPPAIPDGLVWVGYDRARTHELFKRTIARTYDRSLDCPALNGLRDPDDIVAGHQASGEFSPHLWRLLCVPPVSAADGPDPLGVLLLSRVPQAGAVELVYLGLVPEARGRRLGDLLVRHALAAVAPEGLARLTLAVDARNAPALNVYYRNGLAKVGAKVATMRDLRAPRAAAAPAADAAAAAARPTP